MDRLLAEIDVLKARWMTGGAGDAAGPEAWHGIDELGQLALAGQFLRTATRPAAARSPAFAPEIPALPLAPLPEPLRPVFRRALEAKAAAAADIVRLIAARGFGVNPSDWMP